MNQIDDLELKSLRNFAARIKRLVPDKNLYRALAFRDLVAAEVRAFAEREAALTGVHALGQQAGYEAPAAPAAPASEPVHAEAPMSVSGMFANLRRAISSGQGRA